MEIPFVRNLNSRSSNLQKIKPDFGCEYAPACAHWAWKWWPRCDLCPWAREGEL